MPDRVAPMQELFDATGGVHAAAAFDADGEVVLVREDIGRHNAVDKVVGRLVLDGSLPAGELGLFVSGRTSFEIIQKAWAAGFGTVVAVSAAEFPRHRSRPAGRHHPGGLRTPRPSEPLLLAQGHELGGAEAVALVAGDDAEGGLAVEGLGHRAVGVEDQVAVEAAEEPAVVGDGQDGAGELGQGGFERLGRLEVEVVGGLVEQQQVDPEELEVEHLEAGPLAARHGLVGAGAALGEA